MRSIKNVHRRTLAWTTGGLAALAMVGAAGITAASASTSAPASHGRAFSFALVPSAGIRACLPHIGGRVTIVPGDLNDTMRVSIHGAPARSGFDLFVIQTPDKPFGVSWYQSDVQADRHGVGHATVRGIFDVETFSVSPGGTTTFGATHQYHLGLWFNDPNVPFNLGCEPHGPNDKPVVTPFNGEQNAGVQVLNTANFPDNAGPLSHVHR